VNEPKRAAAGDTTHPADWIDQLARQATPPLSRDEVITELMEDAIDRGWRPQPTP